MQETSSRESYESSESPPSSSLSLSDSEDLTTATKPPSTSTSPTISRSKTSLSAGLTPFAKSGISQSRRNLLLEVPRLPESIGAARYRQDDTNTISVIEFSPRKGEETDTDSGSGSRESPRASRSNIPTAAKREKLSRGFSREDLGVNKIQKKLGSIKFHLTEFKRTRTGSGSFQAVDEEDGKDLKAAAIATATSGASTLRGSRPHRPAISLQPEIFQQNPQQNTFSAEVEATMAALSSENSERSTLDTVFSNLHTVGWRESFISKGGLRLLLRAFEGVVFSSDDSRRYQNIATAISCFMVVLSESKNVSLVESSLPEWDRLVGILVGLIHSTSPLVKERTAQLLCKIVLKLTHGYKTIKLCILKSMKRKTKHDQATRLELAKYNAMGAKTGPFEWLLRDAPSVPAAAISIPFFKALLGFLNAVTTSLEDIDERIAFRQQIQRLRLLSIFHNPVFRDAEALQSDLRVLYDSLASDFEELRSNHNKTELAAYFDERREQLDLSPLGHLVVVAARSFSLILAMVIDPTKVTVDQIKTMTLRTIGSEGSDDQYDLYLPISGTGRSRAYSTDQNRVTLIESTSASSAKMSPALDRLKSRPRSSSLLTKGVRLQSNAVASDFARDRGSSVYLELKMAPWTLQVEFIPSVPDAPVMREVSIDPYIKCGNLAPLLVSLFGGATEARAAQSSSNAVEYAIYFKATSDTDSDLEWPRSGQDAIGSDSVISCDEKLAFFDGKDPLSKYQLNRRQGVLQLRPRLLNLSIQIVRDEKSTTIRSVADPSLSVAQLRARLADHARSALSVDMASFISMSKLFLIRSRSSTVTARPEDGRARAGPMDDPRKLSSFGIEVNAVIHVVNQNKPVWVLTPSEAENGYHKHLRHVDITLPFSEIVSSGALLSDNETHGAAASAYSATASLSDVTFLLRHCGKFKQIDQTKSLQDQHMAAYDFIVLEKRSAPRNDSGSGGSSESVTPRSSRELKAPLRSGMNIWDTMNEHTERGYTTAIQESNPPTPGCPLRLQIVSGGTPRAPTTIQPSNNGSLSPRKTDAPMLRASSREIGLQKQPVEEPKLLRAATLEHLIVYLTTRATYEKDPRFADVFFALLPSMYSVEMFLAKLMERFEAPPYLTDPEQIEIKRMVVMVLFYWIRFFFDSMALEQSRESIEWTISEIERDRAISDDPFVPQLRSVFGNAMTAKIDSADVKFPTKSLLAVLRDSGSGESQISSITRVMLDVLKVEDIARQLTWVCARLLRDTKVSHLLDSETWMNAACSDASKKSKTRSTDLTENCIVALTLLFNQISDWISATIVAEPTLAGRVRIIKRVLKLLETMKKMNNYHMVMAIVSGLSESSVTRLKWTWSKISSRERDPLTKAEWLMDFKGSWKNYRAKIAELRSASADFIPALAIASHDLTFIEEGNPDSISVESLGGDTDDDTSTEFQLDRNRPELINFAKRRQIWNVITSVLPQMDPLRTTSKPIYSTLSYDSAAQAFLSHLPQLTGERLYELSLMREPRNSSRADVK